MKPLIDRIMELALRRGKEKARAFCRSETLKRSFQTAWSAVANGAVGYISVPHYWAKYLHDGRKAIRKPDGILVWYKNPADDPRIQPSRPVYRSDNKKLTKQQFVDDYRAGKLIVAKEVGASTDKANPFFSDTGGMQGFKEEVDRIVADETYRYMEEFLRSSGLKNKVIR